MAMELLKILEFFERKEWFMGDAILILSKHLT
jgi:hypothetical protein